jgi:hypothetical protein
MAKPIATPTAFAPLSPPWSLVSLDANFTSANNALNDYSTYSNYLTDTSGAANSITVTTPSGTAFAYAAGIKVEVKVAVTNTSGTVNLNVNSLGNQLVKNPNGTNPVVSQLVAGGIYTFQYDGTNFQVLGSTAGFTGFGNPTAVAGLAAINGTATTAMRSDGAPALDQTIVPTWSGAHTFTLNVTGAAFTTTGATVPANGIYLPAANTLGFASNTTARGSVNSTGNWTMPAPSSGLTLALTGIAGGNIFSVTDGTVTAQLATNTGVSASMGTTSNHAFALLTNGSTRLSIANTGAAQITAPGSGTALQVTGASGSNALYAIANSTSGSSFGMRIDGGTTSADRGLLVNNQAGTTAYFQVRGDGVIQGRGSVAAALVDMTPDTGTFTGTLTGMTAGTTGTVNWVRMGNIACVYITANITGTSNLTTFTMTGLPAAIQPVNSTSVAGGKYEDNTVTECAGLATISGSTITFSRLVNAPPAQYGSTSWTGAGTKGLQATWCITYPLA